MIDPATRRNFAALVAAAFADGTIAEEERLVLHRKATEMNVPIRDMNELIEQGRRGEISVGVPTSTREREELLESMIDIVCADGRVEAPEHHLLAKFASHLRITLPELRLKIRDRMEKRGAGAPSIEPAKDGTRVSPGPTKAEPRPASPAPAFAPRSEPAPPPSAPNFTLRAPAPLPSAGPVHLDEPKLIDPKIADIPPVTLQLIKQAISFESSEEAGRQIERMLDVPKEEAERIIRAVLAAFPDLKPSPAPSPPLQRPRR